MLSWAVLLLAALYTAPVTVDARAYINRTPSFSVRVWVYGLCFPVDGLFVFGRQKKKLSAAKKQFRRQLTRGMLKLARRPEARVTVTGRLGTGDAALTALCAGALQTLLSAPGALVETAVAVRPDFYARSLTLCARCIVPLRGGDIMRAGAVALWRGARKSVREDTAHGQASH